MAAAPRRWAADLLHVWFHRLGPGDWFRPPAAVDRMLERRFAATLAAMRHRPTEEFLRDPQLALAAILLFDQVPRNIYRGTRAAFATDTLARALTHGAIARGWIGPASRQARQFMLMPLMHSEHIADQRLSLAMFAHYAPGNLSFARSHYRMVARFGRFPHRNDALGRRSTPAERKAVAAGNSW